MSWLVRCKCSVLGLRHSRSLTFQLRSLSDMSEARAKAREKIAKMDAKQDLSPNSPLGMMDRSPGVDPNTAPEPVTEDSAFAAFPNQTNPATGEVNGPTGPEPTRYGDWERKGRCSDF